MSKSPFPGSPETASFNDLAAVMALGYPVVSGGETFTVNQPPIPGTFTEIGIFLALSDPVCECGGDKTQGTHYEWCPKHPSKLIP